MFGPRSVSLFVGEYKAAAAGATEISIVGHAIVNPGVAGISAGAAGRLGFEIQHVSRDLIILTGGL